MKKKRKHRGLKLDGTPSLDMCSCYSFHCDPMTVSHEFSSKISNRMGKGLCPSCGAKDCKCKSSLRAGYRQKSIKFKTGEINEEVVRAIRIDTEKTYQEWASILDVPKKVIYDIKKGNTWKGVRIKL